MTRGGALVGVAATILVGGASRVFPIGLALWDKSTGDVAYAVMVGFMVLFVRPTMKPIATGAAATAICFAIETFQLTGIPARAPRLLRIALGSTFAWHDMACYVVGALLVALVQAVQAERGARAST
jgi:hypothetical protein